MPFIALKCNLSYTHIMGFEWKQRFLGRSPLTIVELIIAVMTIVGGIYLAILIPQLTEQFAQASVLIKIVSSFVPLVILAVLLIGSALLDIIGIYRQNYRMRYYGLFGMLLVRFYSLLATIFGIGFLPLTWLPNLTIILVLSVCYFVVRGRMKWRVME